VRTTHQDIQQYRQHGSWKNLAHKAYCLVEDARKHGGMHFDVVLGGGTRLMLALNHRISEDIDLFVSSPAWLGYVSPRLNDRFDGELESYSESNENVKLHFPEGQIDFIVSAPLLSNDMTAWNPAANETNFVLMPPAEILAKKLFFRGWALHARDLFDWIALYDQAPENVMPDEGFAVLLQKKSEEILIALTHLESREDQKRIWANIRSPFDMDFFKAIDWAKKRMNLWMRIAHAMQSI